MNYAQKKKKLLNKTEVDIKDFENGSQIGKYSVLGVIGKGGFGTVYRGIDLNTAQTVAIKSVSLHKIAKEEQKGMEQEIALLKSLQHPNIVRYIDTMSDEGFLHIILEFVENGSLASTSSKFPDGKIPESLCCLYVKKTLEGLKYLHGQGVIHRDIKGANILSTKDGEIKLADFGVATKFQEGKEEEVVGTPNWMAPEIIEMKGQHSPACDIWSIGATLLELYTGKAPYSNLPQMSALFRIVRDDHPPFPEDLPPDMQLFLLECFQKDPNRRASASELIRHAWITKTLGNCLAPNAITPKTPIFCADSTRHIGNSFRDGDDDVEVNDDWMGSDWRQKQKEKRQEQEDEEEDPFSFLNMEEDDKEKKEENEFLRSCQKQIAVFSSFSFANPDDSIEPLIRACREFELHSMSSFQYVRNPEPLRKILVERALPVLLEKFANVPLQVTIAMIHLFTFWLQQPYNQSFLLFSGVVSLVLSPCFKMPSALSSSSADTLSLDSLFHSHMFEVSQFIHVLCNSPNPSMKKSFLSCGGLHILKNLLEQTDHSPILDLLVQSLLSLLELPEYPKSFFHPLFSSVSVLEHTLMQLCTWRKEENHPLVQKLEICLLQASQVGNKDQRVVFSHDRVLTQLFSISNPSSSLLQLLVGLATNTYTHDNLDHCGLFPYMYKLLESPHRGICVQLFYHLCIQNTRRQEKAIEGGILPILIEIIRQGRSWKDFAYPLFFQIAQNRATSIICAEALEKYNAFSFLFEVFPTVWRAHAVRIVTQWVIEEPDKYKPLLLSAPSFLQGCLRLLLLCLQVSNNENERMLGSFTQLCRHFPEFMEVFAQNSDLISRVQKCLLHPNFSASIRCDWLALLECLPVPNAYAHELIPVFSSVIEFTSRRKEVFLQTKTQRLLELYKSYESR